MRMARSSVSRRLHEVRVEAQFLYTKTRGFQGRGQQSRTRRVAVNDYIIGFSILKGYSE